MEPSAQLIEAVQRLRKLIAIAAAPVRREAARLAGEVELVKARRTETRARAGSAAAYAARLGWIPVVGGYFEMAKRDAEAAANAAEASWADFRARARSTSEMLSGARAAIRSLNRAETRARRGDPVPPTVAPRCEELLARVRFLDGTNGRDASRGGALASKVFLLATAAENIARAWDGQPAAPRPLIAGPASQAAAPQRFNRPVETVRRGRPSQLALDFDGTGQVEEEPRIWLPVSSSRTREMIERGARIDRYAPRRGSQLWVPVSERHKVEAVLPLAFRSQAPRFEFPPIRHNAVGQNLWSVFDQQSWNHIRTTAYDRAGHRCQICGKQGGSLWSRIASPEERKRGAVVDCHEVWDWEVVDEARGIGVQRLKRLLVVCQDCHMMFHEGFALWKAKEAGILDKAAEYIKKLRMLVNRCDAATLEAQLAEDRAKWEDNKRIDSWVLDLSHLANQDFMADHTLVLKTENRAGVTPDRIGGIAFLTEDGTAFAAQDARALAEGQSPKPLARASFRQ